MDIKFNGRCGFYVESTDLAKSLSMTHQNLMKKVNKLNSNRYISYHMINDKYCKNGKKVSYRLTIRHLNLLKMYDLVTEIVILKDKYEKEVRERLKQIFG